jgi:TPR repeat protein
MRSTEFDRLCERLSERFESLVPYTAADYALWAESDRFAAALGGLLAPPHAVERDALVTAILELVGPLDSERGPEVFAQLVADALPHEVRMSKTGDALVRFEADRTLQALLERDRGRSTEDLKVQLGAPKPAAAWGPALLGVHPAAPGDRWGENHPPGFVLPDYVEREHDHKIRSHLERIARGAAPEFVIVRGTSCSGKSRAAYEAVQKCMPEWNLFRPLNSHSVAVLTAAPSLPEPTVIWLDDLHSYFDVEHGIDVAGALRHFLERRGQLVILATVWPDAYNRLSDREDTSELARNAAPLFRAATVVDVPTTFTAGALDEARHLGRRDASLWTAVKTANSGAICQTLAAGPELVARWSQAEDPYAAALVTAAIDARGLGLPSELPLGLLRDAVPGYLSEDQRAEAPPDWFEHAMKYCERKVRDVIAPLRRVPIDHGLGAEEGLVRLADYLEHEGRRMRSDELPPEALWEAAIDHTHKPDTCYALSRTADRMDYRRIAVLLQERAAASGHSDAMHELWGYFRGLGDEDTALQWLLRSAQTGNSYAVQSYEFFLNGSGGDVKAAVPYWTIAAQKNDRFAIGRLAGLLEQIGEDEEALRWWRRGHDLGDSHCGNRLAGRLLEAGEFNEAEAIWTNLMSRGEDVALWELLALKCLRECSQQELRATWEEGVSHGCRWSSIWQFGTRMPQEAHDAAHRLPVWEWLHELAEAGNTRAMRWIAGALLPELEDDDYRPEEEAIAYARQWLRRAADAGDSEARRELDWAPRTRPELERDAAEGDDRAMSELAAVLETAGELEDAEVWWRRASELGSDWAPTRLAALLEEDGRPVANDQTLVGAAAKKSTAALLALARAYESDGTLDRAERCLRDYAAIGHSYKLPLIEFLARDHAPGHRQEAEQRLRTLIQQGSAWAGEDERAEELLVDLLRSSGRAEEAERFTRLGLEPDGRTAQAEA